jgi:hypothetical protein
MRLFTFIDGEFGYCALLESAEGAQALRIGAEGVMRASSGGPIETGRAVLDSEDGPLEICWSPAGPQLEFAIDEAVISLHGIAATGSQGGATLAGPGIAWDLPESGYSALRTVWAITAKSSLLVLVSLRPEDSRDHGEELVGAARIVPEGETYGYVEPLLSTEYDENGLHTRATLELWTDDDGSTERGAGRSIASGAISTPMGRLEAARFAWSLGGSPAVGGYEILTP